MHIRPLKQCDFSDVATICSSALFEDELHAFIAPYRREHPECLRQGMLLRMKRRFYAGEFLHVMVTDPDDRDWEGVEEVIGLLALKSSDPEKTQPQWSRLESWFNRLEWCLLKSQEIINYYTHVDRSQSKARLREYVRASTLSSPLDGFADYREIDLLFVPPSQQRRGIGGKLVDFAKDFAIRDRMPLIVYSTRAGSSLYSRKDFEIVAMGHAGGNIYTPGMAWYPETVAKPHRIQALEVEQSPI